MAVVLAACAVEHPVVDVDDGGEPDGVGPAGLGPDDHRSPTSALAAANRRRCRAPPT